MKAANVRASPSIVVKLAHMGFVVQLQTFPRKGKLASLLGTRVRYVMTVPGKRSSRENMSKSMSPLIKFEEDVGESMRFDLIQGDSCVDGNEIKNFVICRRLDVHFLTKEGQLHR